MMRGIRCGLLLLGTGMIMATGATAQQRSVAPAHMPGAAVPSFAAGSASELRRHLRTLAANPNSLEALLGAGRAALDSGDAEAALTFFGRADQVSPRNGRVKAGMARALAHLGQPQAALSWFAQAVALGAPEAEIADDRGLAYDMAGDPRRAQQDYTMALRRRDDPELRRRMALSLAISGEREAALRVIDAQLRRNDRAGWRTQAFVMALTGDQAGANLTAQLMMPAGSAQAMSPFFARLPALSPAQKAMAVHLGHFPNGGRATFGGPARDTTADPGAVALAMGSASAAAVRAPSGQPAAVAARPPVEPARTPRRRPDAVEASSERYDRRSRSIGGSRQPRATPSPSSRQPLAQAEAPRTAPPVSTRWADAAAALPPQPPPQSQPPPQPQPQPPPSAPLEPIQSPSSSQAQPALLFSQPPPPSPAPFSPTSVEAASQSPLQTVADAPALPAADASLSVAPSSPTTSPTSSERPVSDRMIASVSPGFTLAPAAAPAVAEQPGLSRTPLADIAALVDTLPADDAPSPTVDVGVTHPRRHWVQVAGHPNRNALTAEFDRLRGLAPEQLGTRTAFTTPLRTTNRLLVGPFDSAVEAQQFVNELARRNVAAFAWTSPVGQEIERLQQQ